MPEHLESGPDQTMDGIKTFTSSPVVPTPTSGTQAAPKSYVDAQASAGALQISWPYW